MFQQIDRTTDTYKLSDFSATGMTYDGDCIQFLDEENANTYLSVVYLNEEEYAGMEGWWDFDGSWNPEVDRVDNQEFSYGTSFLANFTSGNEITFSFKGEVISGEKTFTFDCAAPFFGNYLPKDLVLSDITATGMTYDGDCIQLLDIDNANTYLSVVYLTEEDYPGMEGWWDFDGSWDPSTDRVDNTPVPAGQGFLGNFTSGNVITFTFPSAI